MNEIELLRNAVLCVVAVAGCFLGIAKVRAGEATLKQSELTGQIEMLELMSKSWKDKDGYSDFIARAQAEKHFSVLLATSIKPNEIPALIEYYDRGFASLVEIGRAWECHTITDQRLSFSLSPRAKRELWIQKIGALACLAICILFVAVGAIVLFYSVPEALKNLMVAALSGVVSFSTLNDIQPQLTACRLAEREIEHCDQSSDAGHCVS